MNKKILFVDTSLRGHRLMYLEALVSSHPGAYVLIPKKNVKIICKQFIMTSGYDKTRNFISYIRWISEIQTIVDDEKIDIVHFLCGDTLYRYFGIGLFKIKSDIVVTYHHMIFTNIRIISYRRIFKKTIKGVVHTEYLKDKLNEIGIKNADMVQYPVFKPMFKCEKNDAKKKIGIIKDCPIIVVMGGTQRYKGLDILLEALNNVYVPFCLYIAGVERDFSFQFIQEHTLKYADNVICNMKYLTDDEYSCVLSAADVLIFPYRFEFDGASGPMTEGVWYRKYIVGSDHGSMGMIINRYKLGKTFKTEDPVDLAKVLNEILVSNFKWTVEAEEYRNTLNVEYFLNYYDLIYNNCINKIV